VTYYCSCRIAAISPFLVNQCDVRISTAPSFLNLKSYTPTIVSTVLCSIGLRWRFICLMLRLIVPCLLAVQVAH